MQKPHSAKVRQSCFSDLFSLQSKQLQPDYVSSYLYLLPRYRFFYNRKTKEYYCFYLLKAVISLINIYHFY